MESPLSFCPLGNIFPVLTLVASCWDPLLGPASHMQLPDHLPPVGFVPSPLKPCVTLQDPQMALSPPRSHSVIEQIFTKDFLLVTAMSL